MEDIMIPGIRDGDMEDITEAIMEVTGVTPITEDHTGPDIATVTITGTTTAAITDPAVTTMENWITGTITVIQGLPAAARGIRKVPPMWIPGTGVVPETHLPQQMLPGTMLRSKILALEQCRRSAGPEPPLPGPVPPVAM